MVEPDSSGSEIQVGDFLADNLYWLNRFPLIETFELPVVLLPNKAGGLEWLADHRRTKPRDPFSDDRVLRAEMGRIMQAIPKVKSLYIGSCSSIDYDFNKYSFFNFLARGWH